MTKGGGNDLAPRALKPNCQVSTEPGQAHTIDALAVRNAVREAVT